MAVGAFEDAIVNRYVKALYETSVEREEEFLKQIKSIRVAIKSLEGSQKLLKRFSLIVNDGEDFVNALITELELCQEIGNFLKLLLYNNRFLIILQVCNAYEQYYNKMNEKKVFYVTYANSFSEQNRASLLFSLQELVQGKVEIISKQDASLIGGLQIRYGSKILDYSLKSKFDRLKKSMIGELSNF